MINNNNMSLKEKFNEFFNSNSETKNLEVVEKVEEKVEKFEEVSLVDGTIINVEPALELGAVVTVMSEDVAVAMPSGEYELADGRLLVVDEAGVIVDLMEKVAEEPVQDEPVDEELNTEATEVQEQKAKKVIESIVKEQVFEIKERLDEVEKLNDFLKKENEELIKTISEFKTFSKEMFEGLMNEPTKEPVKEQFSLFGKKEKKKNIFLEK